MPGGQIAESHIAHLAGAHDVIQRADSLLDGGDGIVAMNLVEIDVVQPEALQALIDARQDVPARQADLIDALAEASAHLGGHDDLVARATQ